MPSCATGQQGTGHVLTRSRRDRPLAAACRPATRRSRAAAPSGSVVHADDRRPARPGDALPGVRARRRRRPSARSPPRARPPAATGGPARRRPIVQARRPRGWRGRSPAAPPSASCSGQGARWPPRTSFSARTRSLVSRRMAVSKRRPSTTTCEMVASIGNSEPSRRSADQLAWPSHRARGGPGTRELADVAGVRPPEPLRQQQVERLPEDLLGAPTECRLRHPVEQDDAVFVVDRDDGVHRRRR